MASRVDERIRLRPQKRIRGRPFPLGRRAPMTVRTHQGRRSKLYFTVGTVTSGTPCEPWKAPARSLGVGPGSSGNTR
jgi:hypothetical protein